jgi:hypothetical protein
MGFEVVEMRCAPVATEAATAAGTPAAASAPVDNAACSRHRREGLGSR